MTITTGTVWLSLINISAYFVRSIGVFMTALRQILLRLSPFIVTAVIVGLGFSHMYYITSKYGSHCDSFVTCQDNMDEHSCSWPCVSNLDDSYAAAFQMFLQNKVELGIFADWRDSDAIFVKWMSYTYAFLVSILLLTVLIAVVSGVFQEVNDNGETEFWNNRYDYIVTKQAILDRYTPNAIALDHLDQLVEPNDKSILVDRFDFLQFYQETFSKRRSDLSDKEYQFFSWWFKYHTAEEGKMPYLERVYFFLERSTYLDIIFPGIAFERVFLGASRDEDNKIIVCGVFRLIVIFVYLPAMIAIVAGSFVLGLVTFGHLWTPGMKELLLCGRTEDNMRGVDKVFRPQLNELAADVDNGALEGVSSIEITKIIGEVERSCANMIKYVLEDHIRVSKDRA